MRVTFATAVLAFALTGAAHAQTPNPAADAALTEGRRLYDLQEWDKAIAKFKEAYALREDAAALFNIAQSYRLKGDCGQAVGFYKTFKRKFPKEKNVDKFIAEMEACAKAAPTNPTTNPTTNPDPNGGTGTGTGTGSTTKPGETTPGETTSIDATKPGETKPGELKPGETKPDETKPVDAKAGDGTAGDGKVGDMAPPPAPSSSGGLRIASYVTVGAGGAAIAVGALFSLKARSAASDAEALGMGDTWVPAIQDRGLRNQRTATAFYIGGGALIAGGVIMYLLSRPTASEASRVTIAPSTEGAQLVWGGSF